MRVQTKIEAVETIATVEEWQSRYKSLLGRDVIHLADEFYLVAEIELPEAEHYGEYPMLEDGVGLARSFVDSFAGVGPDHSGRSDGFFSSVDYYSEQNIDRLRTENSLVSMQLYQGLPSAQFARVLPSDSRAWIRFRCKSRVLPCLAGFFVAHRWRALRRHQCLQHLPKPRPANQIWRG